MDNPNKDETSLKVFNTAKLHAEIILFSKMEMYQTFQKLADFGDKNLDDEIEPSEEIREINRFNGIKGMSETVYNLLIAISSTVKLKGNKQEIKELGEIIDTLEKVKNLFYEHKERFFISTYKENKTSESIDRVYFEKIKKIINTCYINTEILMTRNKLLFADSKDEFTDDEQLMEQIRKEYTEV